MKSKFRNLYLNLLKISKIANKFTPNFENFNEIYSKFRKFQSNLLKSSKIPIKSTQNLENSNQIYSNFKHSNPMSRTIPKKNLKNSKCNKLET